MIDFEKRSPGKYIKEYLITKNKINYKIKEIITIGRNYEVLNYGEQPNRSASWDNWASKKT